MGLLRWNLREVGIVQAALFCENRYETILTLFLSIRLLILAGQVKFCYFYFMEKAKSDNYELESYDLRKYLHGLFSDLALPVLTKFVDSKTTSDGNFTGKVIHLAPKSELNP